MEKKVVDFYPRHALHYIGTLYHGPVEGCLIYALGVEEQDSITVVVKGKVNPDIQYPPPNPAHIPATRLGPANRPDLPQGTFVFSLDEPIGDFDTGTPIVVELLNQSVSTNIAVQIASLMPIVGFEFEMGGFIQGGTTLRFKMSLPFNEVDTSTRELQDTLLSGLKLRFADTIESTATISREGDQYELQVVSPDLTPVCTELLDPDAPWGTASGYVPMTLIFPDGFESCLWYFHFRPAAFIRFEPETIDIAGSSPVAALFSKNIVYGNDNLQGCIGSNGPLPWHNWIPCTSTQAMEALQVEYTSPSTDEVKAQEPLPFQFPVTISYKDTSQSIFTNLRTFSLDALAHPLLIPMDNDFFSLPVYGTNLFPPPNSLIMYVYPTKHSDEYVVSVLDIEYVSASEWRVIGPQSAHFQPLSPTALAWSKNSTDIIALSGCIMTPFFLKRYNGSIPMPPATLQISTYFFDGCTPHLLPRRMRQSTDCIEITIDGKGFGNVINPPKIILCDSQSGEAILEIPASYAPSPKYPGEKIIVAKYYGLPVPFTGYVYASVQIDDSNWVVPRRPKIAIYDIYNDAIQPTYANWWSPIAIDVSGFGGVMSLIGSEVTAMVTFCDDDSVNPGSARWKALTRSAEVNTDPLNYDIIWIALPPRVKYATPSFRLQVSIAGQPPVPTSNLCNMVTVDYLEPAWCLPHIAPAEGEVRILGSNFVDLPKDDDKPLQARLAVVLPGNRLQNIGVALLEATYGTGEIDIVTQSYVLTSIKLQIKRLSSSELVVSGVPALLNGIYDFQIGRKEEFFVPCQRLYNVFAWTTDERTITFGSLQQPTVILPFLSNNFPFPNSHVAFVNQPTPCGRVKIDKFSTELIYDPIASQFSFIAPLMQRGMEKLSLSYAPDGQRFVSMPNIRVVVFGISHIEPAQVAAQVPTAFKLYGSPFLASTRTSTIQIQFHILVPGVAKGDLTSPSTVIGQPNGDVVTIKESDVFQDRLEFSTTCRDSGALIIAFTITDGSLNGSITRSVWPPQYLSMLESGSLAVNKISTSRPWPRIVNAFGILRFEPPVAHIVGDSVISIHLTDPSVNKPPYLLPIVKLDTIRVRFRSEQVYAQGSGSFSYRNTSDAPTSTWNKLALQQNLNGCTALRQLGPRIFEGSQAEYLQQGWVVKMTSGDLPQNDATSIICVRAPRATGPGLYSIALSINGSVDFAPVLSGTNIFLYETGVVLSNNSVYALADSRAVQDEIPIIVTGQFLPPSNIQPFQRLHNILTQNAQLRIGPLSSDSSGMVQPLTLKYPSVTTSSITFFLHPYLLLPETNCLYLQMTETEPFQELGALLSIVAFDELRVTSYLTSYAEEIRLTGAQFPFRRERVASVRLISDNFQLECSGCIQSSSLITFHLPKDGVVGDVYAVSIRFGIDPSTSYLNTGLSLTLYQLSEFEPNTIVANPDAWDSEQAHNFMSIWGFGFNESVQLSFRLCKPDDLTIVFSEKCHLASANELRVQLSSLPPTGVWRVFLVNAQDEMWEFDNCLTVARFSSFFPVFGEIVPQDQAEQISIVTDASELDIYKPLIRWRSESGVYDVTQDKIQVEQGGLICSVPQIDPNTAPLEQEVFIVECAVDHHSTRTYEPPFTKEEVAIWRSINPANRFRFVDVKTISPLYVGTSGGELTTVTFSADLRGPGDEDSDLEVLFGSIPGTDAKWISDNQITVKTPTLPPSADTTLIVHLREEHLPFSGLSVYEVTDVNPSYGIQSSQALHAFGKFLPPGKSGKIYLSLQGTVVDEDHPPEFLPDTAKTSSVPTPTSNDFWFFLPRGLDTSVAYDIWYCPDGNTVPSLLPTAYRPFHIDSIEPHACNISQKQRFTLKGKFPPELLSTPVKVHFENRLDTNQFVDVPGTWENDQYLIAELGARSFPETCELLIKVFVGQEQTAHYVNNPGTNVHTFISVFRLESPINLMMSSTFGGECFIVVDNVPDYLSDLIPSVNIGSTEVKGRLRTSGTDGNDISGILFTAPPLQPGSYRLEATLDATSISWGPIENENDSLYYYEPLPKTNGQAFGVSLESYPQHSNPFVFQADPHNKDTLVAAQCLSNGKDLALVDSNTPLQILNLTGANCLCNGDPIALRTIVGSKWRCFRLRRYSPAFSLDLAPMPDALVVDESDAATEYPDCRESLFGIWRVLPDENGHPYIDPSLQAEIRLGSDRVLIVGQTSAHDIDPSLVEINHVLKNHHGSGGVASTAPILDLDLNTPAGIGQDFLTSPRPLHLPSGVMISTTFQVAVIDAFINFSPPPSPSVPYGINNAIEAQLYAKSTSSLIVDSVTMYVFASDISGSKGNNIWYWNVKNANAIWKPLFDPTAVPQHLLDSKGNIRAVRITQTDIMLFQQSQSSGLLRAIVVTRDLSTNTLTPRMTVRLQSGLEHIALADGAPVFHSKFSVLYDEVAKVWHIFTIPANSSCRAVHVTYKGMSDSPFIDRDSGTVVSHYGIPPPTMSTVTTLFGFMNSALDIGSCAWCGHTAVSIAAVATSANAVSFNRYGGPSITIDFDSPSTLQDVHIPGLTIDNSGIGDVAEDDNKLSLVFKARGGGFKAGDQWLFQILPATISSARPEAAGQANVSATGVFTNDGPLTLEVEVTNSVSRPPSSSGERSTQVTLKASWYKDSNDASGKILVYSSSKDAVVGAKVASCELGNYGVSICLPPTPQTDAKIGDNGFPIARLNTGDKWSFQCHQCYCAVESISQPPAVSFVDSSRQQVYLIMATYHGGGSLICLKIDLKGNLLQYKLLSLRTLSEFQIHTVNDQSSLVFRGITTSGLTWANAISLEVDDEHQQHLYPRLGSAYRMAHLGLLYRVQMGNNLFTDSFTPEPISADLEPDSIHPSCVALAPPGFNTVGAVDVLGASYILGYKLRTNSWIYKGLEKCSTVSQRVNTGIFSPSLIYNIDRDRLLKIPDNVQDALKTDLENQYPGDDNNPFSDGSPIWNVDPIFSDAHYGNNYTRWEPVFKWIYQLSICQSLVEQGATWSGDIHHKVLFVIPVGDTHRAAGKDFWKLRLGMDRQKMLTDLAMTMRSFKYRYSVHIKEQISMAFPDLSSFSSFGGICNVAAVSLCHPVTMSQLGKLPHDLLDGCLGDIITELRYLDSMMCNQVISRLHSWAVLCGLSSLLPANPPPLDDDDDDNNRTSPPSDRRKRSELSRLAESLGPVAVSMMGGMVGYGIYRWRSGVKKAGEKVSEINGRKGPLDGVREYNRPLESTRSWAIDGNVPRTMPSEDTAMSEVGDSFKTDDMVVRDGRDFLNKVDANPHLLDDCPELKEHVSAVEKEGRHSGRAGAVMEGALMGFMVFHLVANWDEMGTCSKVLEIAGLTCFGTKMLGSIIGSKFPALVKGAQAGLEKFGEKMGAELGEKFLANATGRYLSAAGKCISLRGLKILGPIGNVVFAIEGLISSIDDFKHGKVVDGALELASSLAMLGAAICDLLVLAGATAAEGIGEVLMVVVVIIMVVELLKDPDGFLRLMKELGSELFGFESPEDEAIDDFIARLKNWALSTTLARRVDYDVSAYDDWPKIIARDDFGLDSS